MDSSILLILAGAFGFYMAFNIGANDVANAMGTSVGSKSLSMKQAIVAAAIFELAGAILVGGHVTQTVGSGLVHLNMFVPREYLLGMMSALLSAAIWLNIATAFGWPVSTTHSIVGAVWGFGLVAAGPSAIVWSKVVKVVASWIVSPLMGALITFFVFRVIHRRVFCSETPSASARRIAPFLVGVVAFILTLAMFYKGLKRLKLDLSLQQAMLLSAAVSVGATALTAVLFRRRKSPDGATLSEQYAMLESGMFRYLQIVTACFMAFAHGANDVANAIGPLSSIEAIFRTGSIRGPVDVALWILVLGGVGIVLGLSVLGYKVIATIGEKITDITPSRGFSAEFGAATTVLVCSKMGLPISTTHTLVGSVIGVGLARGMGALDLRVIRSVAASWLITLPVAGTLTAVLYYLLRWLF